MRILLASRNFFPANTVGGAQLSMSILGQELQRQGHDVAVVSVDDEAHTGLHRASGLFEYRLALRNLYTRGAAPGWKKAVWHAIDRSALNMTDRYRAVFADFRPDVVNTNVLAGMGLGIWTAAHRANVPIVHTVHDYYLLCIKSGMRRGGTNCATPCLSCKVSSLYPALPKSRWVNEVIYVSEHMKRVHLDAHLFSPRTGASIIHGSYRPEASSGTPSTVPGGPIRVGFFGRIAPDKGLDRLIGALKRIQDRAWELRVGGAGEPGYVDAMRRLAGDAPVTFLGVQRAADFYASTDMVVVPSLWHDPAPRVAYEAGIHGCIPVVSDRGGLPEIVQHGRRGFVFDPESPTSLENVISEALADPSRLADIRDIWRQDAARFDPTYVARETTAIYERAIASIS